MGGVGRPLSLWADDVPAVDSTRLVPPRWTPPGTPLVAVDMALADHVRPEARDAAVVAVWARSAVHASKGAELSVVVAPGLSALAGASVTRRVAAVHPVTLSPEQVCDLPETERRAVSDAFVRVALDGLAAATRGQAFGGDQVLVRLLRHASGSAAAMATFLASARLIAAPDESRVAWALEELAIQALTGVWGPRRARRAFDLVRDSADLTLIPRLQAAYEMTTSHEARRRILLAHRAIAEVSYRVDASTGPKVIRRRTHEGRLAPVDDHLVDLLTAARSSATGRYRGVDLALWSSAAGDGAPVVVDHAVADGTTALDLAERLAAAFPGPEPAASVVGTDMAMELFFVALGGATGVFGYDGNLLQVRVAGRCLRSFVEDDDRRIADDLIARFRTLTVEERQRTRVRWISPAAAAMEAEQPRRLRFHPHDLRVPYPRPVHVARAFGVLYTGLREEADSPVYCDPEEALGGLVALGASVVDGGLVIAGNVVDVDGSLEPHVDVEVWQAIGGDQDGKAALVLCERWGAGLGVGDGPIALQPSRHRGVLPPPASRP